MASSVISVIMDAVASVFTGLGTSITTLWETIVYDATTGLTPFAEWMLVFVGFAIGTGILYAILRKVL